MRGLRVVRVRLLPYLLPTVAFGGAFLTAAAGSRAHLQELWGLTAVPAVAQAVVVGVLAASAALLAPTRRWPLFLVAVLDLVVRSSGTVLAVASFVAATGYRRPRQLVTYGVAATLLALLPTADVSLLSRLGAAPVFVWLPMAVGLWAATRRELLAGLRDRADRLEREQQARAEQARAQERAHIARDMHDVLAHRVSLMVLHAGALAVTAPDPATSTQAELIRRTGTEALGQLRDLLAVLTPHAPHHAAQPAPQPTLADLDGLLDRSRAAGVQVHRCDEGQPRTVPTMVEHAAYRVVQEALTNVHKHAGDASAQVTLRHLPRALTVTISDTGPSVATRALPGSGIGLTGLAERVALLGGTFSAGRRRAGGWAVSATFPT